MRRAHYEEKVQVLFLQPLSLASYMRFWPSTVSYAVDAVNQSAAFFIVRFKGRYCCLLLSF